MCVLTIKKDENLHPLCAKSHIVVLANHEDCIWQKSKKIAPVLCQDSFWLLTSMAVMACQPLCQGDCKNAFCQGILPPDESTIVCLPSGDPEVALDEYWLLKWTLYGLRCSPHHWYDRFNAILQSISMTPSLEDPCLYTGFVRDPSYLYLTIAMAPLLLGVYVNNFVFFLKILQWRRFSATFSRVAKLTSWVLSSGFWASTLHGVSLLPPSPSTSTNLALPLIWSKVSCGRPATRLPLPCHITRTFQSTPLLHLLMPTILPCNSNVKRPIRASSAVSVGCCLLRALFLLWLTPSFHLSQINPRQVT
jgi:hypothetical protein